MNDPTKRSGPNFDSRRPISARNTHLAARVARALTKFGVTPNAISLASIAFAAGGAIALIQIGNWVGPVLCALAIQARLLCNLFDGMVAVEGGRSTATGALYNEVPDRVADSVLLIALGYAADVVWLGWMAALLAALTAYIRVLGGSLGLPQDFRGPMAKQHRMALMTLACLIGAVTAEFVDRETVWLIALAVIAAGSGITCWTRLRAIAHRLEAS